MVLYKVVLKIGRLRKFNRAREIKFNFFTLYTISMQLIHHVPGYKTVPQIFNFAWGLSYGLAVEKRGKIVTKL